MDNGNIVPYDNGNSRLAKVPSQAILGEYVNIEEMPDEQILRPRPVHVGTLPPVSQENRAHLATVPHSTAPHQTTNLYYSPTYNVSLPPVPERVERVVERIHPVKLEDLPQRGSNQDNFLMGIIVLVMLLFGMTLLTINIDRRPVYYAPEYRGSTSYSR